MADDPDDGFATTNLSPEDTGPPVAVFVSQRAGARHDVRVKVSRSPHYRADRVVTVAVRPEPRVVDGQLDERLFRRVAAWIDLDRETIVAFWDGDIAYSRELFARLKALPPEA